MFLFTIKRISTLLVTFVIFIALAFELASLCNGNIQNELMYPFRSAELLNSWSLINQYCYVALSVFVWVIMVMCFYYTCSDNKKNYYRPARLKYILVTTVFQLVLIFISIALFAFVFNKYPNELIYIPHIKYLVLLPVVSLIILLICFIFPSKKFMGWWK